MLSSSVVTNPRVPRLVRHSLNLESGMNDGLALPAVLAFSAALAAGEDDFVWYEFVLQDVTFGFAFGIGLGFLAAWLMPRGAEDIPAHHKSLYMLGVAFATYGVAVSDHPVHGNGFIAVFVCAITLGIRRPDLGRHFDDANAPARETADLGVGTAGSVAPQDDAGVVAVVGGDPGEAFGGGRSPVTEHGVQDIGPGGAVEYRRRRVVAGCGGA